MDEVKNESTNWKKWTKLIVGLALVGGFCAIYFALRDHLNLESLAARESELREFQSQNPFLVYGLAFVVYVLVTGFSVPGGATVLSLLYAWYFGFWQALILVSFASTLGATISFLSSRFLFRESLNNRFGEQLRTVNKELEKEGGFYLLTLRLIPVFPFFAINLIMGLTPIKTWTFWWVSQLGMLPGTAVYLWAGSSVPNLKQLAEEGPGNLLPIIIAFAVLGTFPLIVKWVLRLFGKGQPEPQMNLAEESES